MLLSPLEQAVHKRSLSLTLLSFLLTTATVGAQMRDKTRASDFGLHGPVKQTIERITYPAGLGTVEQHSTTTITFASDGAVTGMTTQFADNPPYSRTYSHGQPDSSDNWSPPTRWRL